MAAYAPAVGFEMPHSFQITSGLLEDFERGLDPLNPQSSRIPCKVLGYGEISTVFEIQVDGLHDLAFKRMCCFESLDELKPYVDAYLLYNRLLESPIGLHLPAYDYAQFVSESGRPVFYIIQQRLLPESIGNNALQFLPSQQIIDLFRLALLELHKVWDYNRGHPDCQVGIDGQISNWAIAGFDRFHPEIGQDATLLYIDTSTPLVRLNGVEQINAELFLRSAPPYLAWILRALFLQDVVNRYYEPCKVIIDLIANIYKEQRPELIPDLLAEANAYIRGEGADLGLAEITEKQVRDYYRQDELIWRLYLDTRRFDRFLHRKVLHRAYPYILPGKIKR